MKKNIFLLFSVLLLISCEGPKHFSILVIDSQTKKPIDNVHIQITPFAGKEEKTAYKMDGYTDSLGKFEQEEMVGYGLSLKKWDWKVDYERKGYQKKSELNKSEGTVELHME